MTNIKNKFHKRRILSLEEGVENEYSHESGGEDSPRSDTKAPSRRIQKDHLETQIIH